MVEQINQQEEEKRTSSLTGINKSFTLVRNEALNKLDKVPDLSSHWAENPGLFPPFLPQNNEEEQGIGQLTTNDELVEVLNVDVSKLLKKVNK